MYAYIVISNEKTCFSVSYDYGLIASYVLQYLQENTSAGVSF